jgi:hypothetical protein
VLRGQGISDTDDFTEIRLAMWVVRVVLDEKPFRLDFDAAESGALEGLVSPDDLVADDPSACRQLSSDLA